MKEAITYGDSVTRLASNNTGTWRNRRRLGGGAMVPNDSVNPDKSTINTRPSREEISARHFIPTHAPTRRHRGLTQTHQKEGTCLLTSC